LPPKLQHLSHNTLAWLWGHLRPSPPITTPELLGRLNEGRIRKILLIRPHQNIGDLILATPLFRALKRQYPSVELHFLGTRYNLAAVRDNPRLTKIWTWDKYAMWYPHKVRAFFQSLRREQFDLALVLFSNAPSFTSFLIAQLSGADIVGSNRTDAFYGGTNWSRWMTNWQTPAFSERTPEYLKFFSGAAPFVEGPPPAPEYAVSESVTAWAQAHWEKMRLPENPAPIALFLGGNPHLKHRLWLGKSWGHLAKLIRKNLGPVVAVCPPPGLRGGGGTKELNLYKEFRAALGEDVPVFDEPGLPQAAAFLKPMRLFICLDGGLFHIASAAGVRTLGLFFGSDPDLWRPPLDTVFTIRAPQGRPECLSPEAVFQKVQAILPKSSDLEYAPR
jgi:heptosyltransferase III